MDSMFTLGVILSAKDMLSPTMGRAGQSVTTLSTKLEAVSGKMAMIGTASYGMGRAMLSPVMDTINAYQDLAKAQGDIASLGIGAEGINAITKSAKEFSNQFAGTTASDFVAASYDIKSGISSLSDEGVAKFTKLSAMTGAATKATTAEMTKLFALGYGIFKDSKETDFEFGERMSAQVSLAVKAFRTDGADLTLGISNIGAQAQKMGVSLSEELSIIGNAKSAFNSASEAATGYRAFLDGAANAQDKLGLTFTDAQGKMLPMVNVLKQIKEKYGDNIGTLAAQQELKKAFGSSEAVKIVNALVEKTDDLTASQKELNAATMENVESMALSRNKGKEFDLLNQQIGNLSSTIGALFAPAATKMASVIGSVVTKIQTFSEEHETAATVIGYTVAGIGALLTVVGAVFIPIAAVGAALPALAAGFAIVSSAASFMGVAMSAAFGPIGIAVAVIAGVAYAIYSNWEPISAFVGELWEGIKNILVTVWENIKTVFAWSPLGLIVQGWGAMFDWLSSKFEWFSDAASKMGEIGESIAGFFGFGEGDKKIEVGKTVKNVAVGTALATQMAVAQPAPVQSDISTKAPTQIVASKPVQPQSNSMTNAQTKIVATQPTPTKNSIDAKLPSKIVPAQPTATKIDAHSVSSNNSYNITIQVQGSDPREIAKEVKKVIVQMEQSRKNRSYSDMEV